MYKKINTNYLIDTNKGNKLYLSQITLNFQVNEIETVIKKPLDMNNIKHNFRNFFKIFIKLLFDKTINSS